MVRQLVYAHSMLLFHSNGVATFFLYVKYVTLYLRMIRISLYLISCYSVDMFIFSIILRRDLYLHAYNCYNMALHICYCSSSFGAHYGPS